MCPVVVSCYQRRQGAGRCWHPVLMCVLSCIALQLTSVDYFGQAGAMSVEQLLMELRESRDEISRLREEIDSTKVS